MKTHTTRARAVARPSISPLLAAIPLAVAALTLGLDAAQASSHREAPFITTTPKVDATDFYMFRSYENGRADYVGFRCAR